jgi:DNA-binding GntR family transcriptional regulator
MMMRKNKFQEIYQELSSQIAEGIIAANTQLPSEHELVVVECTEEDKQLLDLDGFQHIVVVKNYVYLDDASLFQYTESRHRLDKFRFVDFARRGR